MVSVILPKLELHLRNYGLRRFVIFLGITDFEKLGFLHNISLYLYCGTISVLTEKHYKCGDFRKCIIACYEV
jgi:hypothetical protein